MAVAEKGWELHHSCPRREARLAVTQPNHTWPCHMLACERGHAQTRVPTNLLIGNNAGAAARSELGASVDDQCGLKAPSRCCKPAEIKGKPRGAAHGAGETRQLALKGPFSCGSSASLALRLHCARPGLAHGHPRPRAASARPRSPGRGG